jgi:cell fate regulator YaaT (PSP1 superfamily)
MIVVTETRTAALVLEDGTRVTAEVPPEVAIHKDDQCVVDCDGIAEAGRVLRLGTAKGGAGDRRRPRVLRCATLQDMARSSENAQHVKMAEKACEEAARQCKVHLKLVRVRYCLDRSLLTVRFTAEENTDVREVIRLVGQNLGVRVDMRQRGVRDDAAIVGGVGTCGRRLCCCSWLAGFEVVNVRMAKAQGVSLNPSSMSGNCGRLKCCLRYEHAQYEELGRDVPRVGWAVETTDGRGVVIGCDVLRQRVRVRLESDRIAEYAAGDVMPDWRGRRKNRRPEDEDTASERAEPEPSGEA